MHCSLGNLLKLTLWVGLVLCMAGCNGDGAAGPGALTNVNVPPPASTVDNIGHVFIIVLENKDYSRTFNAHSLAPYLAKTLPAKGALLKNYYGTAHLSNGNYIAMVSGQGPNVINQLDCIVYLDFIGVPTQNLINGQAVGEGCVYPTWVANITDQFRQHGVHWMGYMEDMGADPGREASTCAHPPINTLDQTQSATASDNYATRHNPFMYFHAIIDDQAYCDAHVVNLKQLPDDLKSIATTAHYNFIVPGLCHDGHDSPCANGEPGGLQSINVFLRQWVPRILAAPAFQKDGLLIITFDESDGPQSDSSACCGEGLAIKSPLPGLTGPGGGRIGAVLLSPFIKPGTVSTKDYNHYSMLRTVEDIFGLPYLGYAGIAQQSSFGADVFTRKMPVFPDKH